jgi:hypothetical protein
MYTKGILNPRGLSWICLILAASQESCPLSQLMPTETRKASPKTSTFFSLPFELDLVVRGTLSFAFETPLKPLIADERR